MIKSDFLKDSQDFIRIVEENGFTPTILAVDDEPAIIDITETIFIHIGLYNVITSENGVEAMKIISKRPVIDMVFVDDVMPEMEGHTLAEEIRKMPEYSDIPIVMIGSAYGDDYIESFLEKSGGSAYVRKPYQIKPLVTLTNKLLVNHYKLQAAKKDNQQGVISRLMAEREDWKRII